MIIAKAIYEIEYALNAVCAHGGIATPKIKPVAVKAHDEVVELSVHIPGVDLHKYSTLLGAAMTHVQNNANLPLRVRDASLEHLESDRYQLYY